MGRIVNAQNDRLLKLEGSILVEESNFRSLLHIGEKLVAGDQILNQGLLLHGLQ